MAIPLHPDGSAPDRSEARSDQAARTVSRNLPTSSFSLLLSADSDCAAGPRLRDWCYLGWPIDAGQFNIENDGLWTRGLLIRRRIADDDLAFFTTWCPPGTGIETPVAVEGYRWAIEDSFETAKNELGSITMRADRGIAGIATSIW
jgi:hypothetical protein